MKKVYICSSLRIENHAKVTEVLKNLPAAIHLRPYLEQSGNKLGHVEVDVAMIHHCDELWVVGEYGKDCSWELGYATAIGKPIVVYRDHSNSEALDKDWMLHHAAVIGLLSIVNLADI